MDLFYIPGIDAQILPVTIRHFVPACKLDFVCKLPLMIQECQYPFSDCFSGPFQQTILFEICQKFGAMRFPFAFTLQTWAFWIINLIIIKL